MIQAQLLQGLLFVFKTRCGGLFWRPRDASSEPKGEKKLSRHVFRMSYALHNINTEN
jgi:hypothetical protein